MDQQMDIVTATATAVAMPMVEVEEEDMAAEVVTRCQLWVLDYKHKLGVKRFSSLSTIEYH